MAPVSFGKATVEIKKDGNKKSELLSKDLRIEATLYKLAKALMRGGRYFPRFITVNCKKFR